MNKYFYFVERLILFIACVIYLCLFGYFGYLGVVSKEVGYLGVVSKEVGYLEIIRYLMVIGYLVVIALYDDEAFDEALYWCKSKIKLFYIWKSKTELFYVFYIKDHENKKILFLPVCKVYDDYDEIVIYFTDVYNHKNNSEQSMRLRDVKCLIRNNERERLLLENFKQSNNFSIRYREFNLNKEYFEDFREKSDCFIDMYTVKLPKNENKIKEINYKSRQAVSGVKRGRLSETII